MAVFPVVLDACVLFPPVLRVTLFRAAEKGFYRLVLSDAILEETTRNIMRREGVTKEMAQRLEAAIGRAFPESFCTPPKCLVDVMKNDPKDRHVLATAVLSHASVIVSQNTKDFPPDALAPYGIEVQSPDTFLVHLFDLDREAMTNLIWEQAADKRKPPRSASEIVRHIATHAPAFAERCRATIMAIESGLQ
jgi:predicted nucleic acid-binding protein